MKTTSVAIAVTLLAVAGVAGAGDKGHQPRAYGAQEQLFDYATVVEVEPRYREVEVSHPVRECRQEPVYQTERREHKSASGMLAGGLIGGIVGHQFGKGRGQRAATAMGALIGASIGHDAVNGHDEPAEAHVVGYEEHCQTYYRTDFETVVDFYAVTYKYRGKTYHLDMPYDPGERIKMRIQITPVI